MSAAVVTGGSAGIGRAVVEGLLRSHDEVVSLDIQPCEPRDRVRDVQVDLTDTTATAQIAGEIARAHQVTTIVHNAGVIRPALLPDVQLGDFSALVNLHLSAGLLLAQAALPAMKAAGYGRIVLVSSRAVLGLATRTSYSATKAGMLGMARTWALELAPHGITVNVVAPGPVHTEMFYDVIPAGSEREQKLAASIPVGRVGEPGDVARAVSFFIHPDAGFITSQTLYVCGGASLGSIAL